MNETITHKTISDSTLTGLYAKIKEARRLGWVIIGEATKECDGKYYQSVEKHNINET